MEQVLYGLLCEPNQNHVCLNPIKISYGCTRPRLDALTPQIHDTRVLSIALTGLLSDI